MASVKIEEIKAKDLDEIVVSTNKALNKLIEISSKQNIKTN